MNSFSPSLACASGARNLEVGEEPVEAVAGPETHGCSCWRLMRRTIPPAGCGTLRKPVSVCGCGAPLPSRNWGRPPAVAPPPWSLLQTSASAVAVVRRLAEMDPEKYDEDLAKLELKAKRAAERKSEAAQHEKNLRRGIKRPKKQEVPDAKEVRPADVSGKPSGEKQRRSAGVSDKRAEKAGPRRTAENGGAAKSFAKDDRTGRPFRKSGSRPSKSNRPKPKGRPNPYAHSRPVKKGKGSFRKKEN